MQSCVELISSKGILENKIIFVHGAFGGRIDHTLNSIYTLHKYYQNTTLNNEMILFDKYSKMMYVRPGLEYYIKLSKTLDLNKGAGLIPIPLIQSEEQIKNNRVVTKGFKWDIG